MSTGVRICDNRVSFWLVCKIPDQLKEDGLHEDMIVFFWSDHSHGLPRYKRWFNTTSPEVALIVYVPPKFRQKMWENEIN